MFIIVKLLFIKIFSRRRFKFILKRLNLRRVYKAYILIIDYNFYRFFKDLIFI